MLGALLLFLAFAPTANAEVLSDAPISELISRLATCDTEDPRQVISELGQRGTSVYAEVQPLLTSSHACTQAGAAAAIDAMGPDVPDSELIGRVVKCRSDKADQTEYEIGRRGKEILPALVPLLSDRRACVRYGALAAIQAMASKYPAALESASIWLDDPDRKVRSLAVDIADGHYFDQNGGWSGSESAILKPTVLRITTLAEWICLWNKLYDGRVAPPPVAFSKDMVVAVFLGKNRLPYSLSIAAARVSGETHVITDIRFYFARHANALTYIPKFGMVVLPKSSGKVVVAQSYTPTGSFVSFGPHAIITRMATFAPLRAYEKNGADSPGYADKQKRLHEGLKKMPDVPRKRMPERWSSTPLKLLGPGNYFDQRAEIASNSKSVFLLEGSELSAVSKKTGTEIWRLYSSGPAANFGNRSFDGELSVDSGRVFFALNSPGYVSYIAAVDAKSGRLIWTRSLSSAKLPRSKSLASTASHGLVFAVAYRVAVRIGQVFSPYALLALDENDGRIRWEKNIDPNIGPPAYPAAYDIYAMSRPAYVHGIVYFTTPWGQVFAQNAESGKDLWTFSLQPTIDLSRVSGTLVAVSKPVGLSRYGASSPVVVDGAVNFASPDGFVYSLNSGTGSVLWKKRVDGDATRSLGKIEHMICWTSGSLSCLDARSGAPLWEKKPSRHVSFDADDPPNYVDGKIWVGNRANVAGLNPKTGRIADDLVAAPSDRITRFASDDKYLYIIRGQGLTQLVP